MRDYGPASFHIEDLQLLTDEVFEYDGENPESNAEFLLVMVEDQYGNTYQEEFQIAIKEQGSSSTGIFPSGESRIHIYPNPADEYFVIPELATPALSFRVIGMTGKEVLNHPGPVLPGSPHSVEGLEEGVYFILLTGEDHRFTGKLVVQHR